MIDLTEIPIQPGLFTEDTDRSAVRRWKSGDHVRFRNGLPEKTGGIVAACGNVRPIGKARAVHDWVSLDGQKWLAIGTDAKLYVYNQCTLYDITPYRRCVVVSNPFTTVSGSKVVTVNDPGHGALVGDYVQIENAQPVSGLDMNGERIITSISTDTWTFEHTGAANATTVLAGGGDTTLCYEISTFVEEDAAFFGYSRKGWNEPNYQGLGWGTPELVTGELQDRIRPRRIWSLDNWGEDLMASPRGGAVYVWERSDGPLVRAKLVPNAPAQSNRILVGHDERVLITLGTTTRAEVTDYQDPMFIRWSAQEDYNDFEPTIANLAGDKRLGNGSVIITAVKTRNQILIFTDEALYAMQFVGPPDVYQFTPLATSVNVVGPQAAADANGVVFFMGPRDFYIYDGVLNVLECDVHTMVFGSFNIRGSEKVTCAHNRLFREVTWCYPSLNSAEPNRYVTYNYREKHWTFGTTDRSVIHDYSSHFSKPYGIRASDNLLVIHETGVNDLNSAGNEVELPTKLTSYDFELAGGSQLLHNRRLVPDMKRMSGDGVLYLRSKQYPQSQEVFDKGPYIFDGTTKKIDVRIRNRQLAIEYSQSGLNTDWRMGTWRTGVVSHGKR